MLKYLLLLLPISIVAESNIDQKLFEYTQTFRLEALKPFKNDRPKLYQFGKLLFEDDNLSMNKNISCKTCHDDSAGTTDGLPFSIGAGGIGLTRNRIMHKASMTSRSAPHLYNKGYGFIRTMFWDGRVLHNIREGTYVTPEKKLNGQYPELFDIKETIENVLAMQALFPIANDIEMKGSNYSEMSNEEVWSFITSRIKKMKKYQEYTKDNGFNIGHIANALAYFQKIEYQVTNTRWDKYVSGDKSSLSDIEKRGALLFNEKGRCSRCHNGPLLSNLAFQNIAVPQIGPGVTKDKNDEGRFLVNNNEAYKYGFLTQPLRNVALTSPYMHNGSLVTLTDVVNHYNNAKKGLDNYIALEVQKLFGKNFNNRSFYVDKNQYNNFYRKQTLAPMLRSPLNLSMIEKKELICFLKKSLTDIDRLKELNLSECK